MTWPRSQAPPSFPSLNISTEKRERAWYLFSREWCQDRKDGRKDLIVRGCTGPRTAKRANVAGDLLHVSSERRAIVVYTKCWACSRVEQYTKRSLFWKFSQFSDYVMLMWEKIPGYSAFVYCKGWKAGRGLGTRLWMTLTLIEVHSERSTRFIQAAFVCLGWNSLSGYCQMCSRSTAIAVPNAQCIWVFSLGSLRKILCIIKCHRGRSRAHLAVSTEWVLSQTNEVNRVDLSPWTSTAVSMITSFM